MAEGLMPFLGGPPNRLFMALKYLGGITKKMMTGEFGRKQVYAKKRMDQIEPSNAKMRMFGS